MKTRIILSLLIFSTIVYSCKKENAEQTDNSQYFFTALKNNTSWSASPVVSTYQDTLYIQATAHEEFITMKIKYNGIGTYTLTGGQAYDWLTVGQDAIVGKYNLSSNAVSTVTITSYDMVTKEAVGTFDLKLTQTYPIVTNPSPVNFTSGKFKSTIR